MKPVFIMMVGLPGSGKSTDASELAIAHDATIFSSDSLREELFGDINHQADNTKLFEELHKRIKDCLKEGKSAIYDATNINYKRRMAFLAELKNIPCKKICVLMATPYEECLKRNAERDRKVPEDVIKRMYMNISIPYWYEGWDDIQIKYSTMSKKNIMMWLGEHIYDSQDNPHHSLTLGDHCLKTGTQLADNPVLMCAGLLHDCGKPFVKSFVNARGEQTEVAHYYQHQCPSSYDSLFFSMPVDVNPLDVAILINLHMQPYFNKEEKTKNKYRKLWGEELYNNVMKLHAADKASK